QLRPAPHRPLQQLDPLDPGRVQRERALDAHAVRDAPYRERGPGAASALADDDALEGLQPRFLALGDLDRDLHGVTGDEAAPVLPDVTRLHHLDRFHGSPPAAPLRDVVGWPPAVPETIQPLLLLWRHDRRLRQIQPALPWSA